ncbi:MAG: tetratricopeptide (TPR) repeat protein [Chlamydiales bacterium]|jgi:tetratricopeptide (TPR) repeat protein
MSDERTQPAVTRKEASILVVILCVTALLRAFYVAEFAAAPDFEHPFIDAGFHDNWARSMAFEDWVRPAHLPDPELETTPYLRPPGYPVFLALIYRVFGPGYVAPRIVQAGLGLIAVFLIYRLGRRLADPAVGLTAAALFGSAWVPIYFEAEFHATALLTVLLLGLWQLLAAWSERPGVGRALLAGAVLGLAALVRPNALALLPLVLVWGTWVHRRALSGSPWTSAGAFLLACLLAIAPATLRNWRASGEFVPITTGLGVNLFLGNHARATGQIGGELPGIGRFDTCYDYPAVVASVQRRVGRELTQRQVSSWFVEQALAAITGDPSRALSLTARKLRMTLAPAEISHNKVLVLEREHSAVLSRLPGPFSVYLAGALVGFAAWWSDRRRVARIARAATTARAEGGRAQAARTETGLLLASSGVVLLVSLLPFFAAARYRVPLLPLAVLFAAYGLLSVVRWARRGKWGPVFLSLVAFALPTVGLLGGVSEGAPDRAKWHCDRGRSLRRAGDFEGAQREYQLALAVRPPRATVFYEYGLLCAQQGQEPSAIDAYRRAIELDPTHLLATYNLGTLLARGGVNDEALAFLEQALGIEPRYSPAHLNVAVLHFNAGAGQRARAACLRMLEFDPGNVEARRLLARSHERLGEYALAVGVYESLLSEDPRSPSTRQKLAWILSTSSSASVRDGRRALALVEPLGGPQAGAEVLGTLAAALAETGDFARALEVARRALALAREQGQGRRVAVLRAVLEACEAGRPVRPGP